MYRDNRPAPELYALLHTCSIFSNLALIELLFILEELQMKMMADVNKARMTKDGTDRFEDLAMG